MSTKKNIDRLFQEKFKEFEVAPNDAVWERLSESLTKKRKKRRVIPLWWQAGGVAAALLLLFALVNFISNQNDDNLNNSPNFVDTEKDSNFDNEQHDKSSKNKQIEITGNDELDSSKYVDSKEEKESFNKSEAKSTESQYKKASDELNSSNKSRSNTVANSSAKKDKFNSSEKGNNIKKLNGEEITKEGVADNSNNNDSEILDKTKINSVIEKNKATSVAENSTSNNSDNTSTLEKTQQQSIARLEKIIDESESITKVLSEEKNKENIEDAIAAQEDTDEKEKEDEQNRWSIVPNVAPVYFSSLGNGSALDKQFNENSKSGDINMSYGIAASYSISKKLSVRAGINRVNLSQTTSDVFTFSSNEFSARFANNNSNIKVNNNVIVMSANMLSSNTTPEVFNTKTTTNLDQRFGFIEVPLELEYSVLDKKFGLNVIGGFSTFFLSQNEIYADVDGTSTMIGKANNINSTSFSANLGLGLDYKLSKQWNINLEPQFKYQINTFNNTSGDFRPFFIGVYTGLSFKF